MKHAFQFAFDLNEPGGGCIVGAWAAQALLREYRVTLLVWSEPSLERIDRACGTALAQAEQLAVEPMPRWLRALFACQPLRLALVRRGLMERRARRLLKRLAPDVVVSTANEVDLGRPAVQYVHYPWRLYPRPQAELRWYHPRLLVALYARMATVLESGDPDTRAASITLANSDWTAERYRTCYGLPARTLNPPVPVAGRGRDWAEREERFVVVGRVAREKRLIEAVRAVARVREAGWAVGLTICALPYDAAYLSALREELAAAGAWAELRLELSREALTEQIGACRYGLHMMIDEHFGISVAEMLRLGCIPFAHASGGPQEMLEGLPLLFRDDEEAVALILERLSDRVGTEALLPRLAARAAGYGTERFEAALLDCCRELAGQRGDAG